MKPQPIPSIALVLTVFCPHARAASSASADYAITADAVNPGGAVVASANYRIDASAGNIAGISNEAAAGYTLKHGFAGQLYDATALQPAATPSTLDENNTRQLDLAQLMDDGTSLPLAPAAAAWSVVSGPVTGISAGGLATAGTVYQDTAATVRAEWQGLAGTLDLTVINTGTDDYGLYAADGLPDDWQVLYFGIGNPLAGPLMDPDGDSQNNSFEFTAGLDPTNPLSRFLLRIEPVPGQPQQKNLVFGPIASDLTYQVLRSSGLTPASWQPLAGTPPTTDDGNQRTVTDTSATEPAMFYRVEIQRP
ncbi:MAG: hypothetical protein MUF04_00920 [Akkermansiaceae bacterium]|nr:hypothetical protein [Akkermansiaceae bacterium]